MFTLHYLRQLLSGKRRANQCTLLDFYTDVIRHELLVLQTACIYLV